MQRLLLSLALLTAMCGARAGALHAPEDQLPARSARSARRSGHTPRPAELTRTGALTAADARRIAWQWGIEIESLRLTSSGYMLDFRYRVLDARKARPLFARRTKPILIDEATGAQVAVPVPPKTGALRNSNDPKAGRTYFMFFANPGRFIKAGNLVTVTIGTFSVAGIRVDGEHGGEATR